MMPLHIFSQARLNDQPFHNQAFARYQEALDLFWQGNWQESIKLASSMLLKPLTSDFTFACYRLWIEALCELGDGRSLKLLQKHLLQLGAESDMPAVWLGLRALTYLELDEWQACQLIYEALDADLGNPYILEFKQRYHLRLASRQEASADLLQASVYPFDYFHWQSLAKALLLRGAQGELEQVLDYVQQRFPGSPLRSQFLSYLAFENQSWAEADSFAAHLCQQYPAVEEFQFLHAYLQGCLGNYSQAIDLWQSLLSRNPQHAEAMLELAHCHYRQAETNGSSFHWEQACQYGGQAIERLQNKGLPVSFPLWQQKLWKQELASSPIESSVSEAREKKFWLVELSQQAYHHIATAKPEVVANLFWPMGSKAGSDDVVFFVVRDALKLAKRQLRLVAVYQVTLGAVTHPFEHFQVVLSLVKRIALPVYFPMVADTLADRRRKGRPYDPAQYGAFALDDQAVRVIMAELSEQAAAKEEKLSLQMLYRKIS